MYDATFLGPTVDVPEPVGEVADDVLDVDGTTQWDYTHFSLAMSASRRLARWVAWQIDGLTLFPGDSIPRADDFRLDPRLPAEDSRQARTSTPATTSTAATSHAAPTCCGAPSTKPARATRTRSSSPTSRRR